MLRLIACVSVAYVINRRRRINVPSASSGDVRLTKPLLEDNILDQQSPRVIFVFSMFSLPVLFCTVNVPCRLQSVN